MKVTVFYDGDMQYCPWIVFVCKESETQRRQYTGNNVPYIGPHASVLTVAQYPLDPYDVSLNEKYGRA